MILFFSDHSGQVWKDPKAYQLLPNAPWNLILPVLWLFALPALTIMEVKNEDEKTYYIRNFQPISNL